MLQVITALLKTKYCREMTAVRGNLLFKTILLTKDLGLQPVEN